MPKILVIPLSLTTPTPTPSSLPFELLIPCNVDVFTVCKLKTNLNVVPRELFDKRIAENGQPYYHIQFNLSMKIQNALVFAFEFKGKTYSSVEATFA